MHFLDIRTGEYPVTHSRVREMSPNISFPEYFDTADGYVMVHPSPVPSHDRAAQHVVEGRPVFQDGVYRQTWVIVDFSEDERNNAARTRRNHAERAIVSRVQSRLDEFARTRNYDGILSACSYASSQVPKFQLEGQYAVFARDATWGALYEIMGEVENGTRPEPTGYPDIEPLLPVLEWPQ